MLSIMALNEATIIFSLTPTVSQTVLPSVVSILTLTFAAVPDFESKIRTLKSLSLKELI